MSEPEEPYEYEDDEPDFADAVHRMIPDDFDWEELVRDYPLPAMAVALVGGFVLGRSRGPMVLTALSTFAAGLISRQINELLGADVVPPPAEE